MNNLSNAAEFQTEVTQHAGVVLVDFYTQGCTPCRMMNPILEELAKERPDLKIVKVDAASNFEIAVPFSIATVPTFVLFSSGQVRGQFSGSRSKKDLVSWIEATR